MRNIGRLIEKHGEQDYVLIEDGREWLRILKEGNCIGYQEGNFSNSYKYLSKDEFMRNENPEDADEWFRLDYMGNRKRHTYEGYIVYDSSIIIGGE